LNAFDDETQERGIVSVQAEPESIVPRPRASEVELTMGSFNAKPAGARVLREANPLKPVGEAEGRWVTRRFFSKLWARWKKIAHRISAVQTFLLLSLIFLLVLGPTALLMRMLRRNPLSRPKSAGTFWVLRPKTQERADDCLRQF